jgi:curved DNA-binding protein CbpA
MERNASTISASTINQAYQALRCPVDRAKYLVSIPSPPLNSRPPSFSLAASPSFSLTLSRQLSLQGINALNEDSSFVDPELMVSLPFSSPLLSHGSLPSSPFLPIADGDLRIERIHRRSPVVWRSE